MANKSSLREAKTSVQLCALDRDNFAYGDFWLLADESNVYIYNQKLGERPTQKIKIPKRHFNFLIDSYDLDQKSASKKANRK